MHIYRNNSDLPSGRVLNSRAGKFGIQILYSVPICILLFGIKRLEFFLYRFMRFYQLSQPLDKHAYEKIKFIKPVVFLVVGNHCVEWE